MLLWGPRVSLKLMWGSSDAEKKTTSDPCALQLEVHYSLSRLIYIFFSSPNILDIVIAYLKKRWSWWNAIFKPPFPLQDFWSAYGGKNVFKYMQSAMALSLRNINCLHIHGLRTWIPLETNEHYNVPEKKDLKPSALVQK